MQSKHPFNKLGLCIAICAVLTPAVQAQVLEEIVVTAQRREQSIQEVPISLDTFGGAELALQGFRTMEDLSNFSPSVEIDVRIQDQDVSIRGIGTTGNNLGLEQAVPIFNDGVHLGRTSMIMGAFLDLERIEVLRGPQPVAFGQNATAGAFSLVTRKPGDEWQGDVTAEYGNFGRASVEGGVGGPVSDTLGIRLAGKYDRITGFIRDVVTASMFPKNIDYAGRLTLQWNPVENFEAVVKVEYSNSSNDGDGNALCKTEGEPELLENKAVFIPGLTPFDDVTRLLPLPEDCDTGFKRIGIREGGENTFKPVQGIRNQRSRTGIIDISEVPLTILDQIETYDQMTGLNYRLGLTYNLDNGGYIESTTAYVDFARHSVYENGYSPFLTNLQHRGEVFDMWSQDLRYISARGKTLEWEAGVYWQIEDLDLGNPDNPKYMTSTIRGTMRDPVRVYNNWQDSEWMSAFASITYNFMDDKASIDLGGRYSKVKKDSFAQGWGATWIMDVNPDPDNDGLMPATQLGTTTVRTLRFLNAPSGANRFIIDCATGHPYCGSYGAGYWTHEWDLRDIPDSWNTEAPVAAGPLLSNIGNAVKMVSGPYLREYSDSNFDPQVVLRFRPTDALSLYAKWATAFKGGGANIATGTLNGDPERFHIEAEYAETFEIGAKGDWLDNSFAYNISLFQIEVDDLQIATSFPSDLSASGSSFSTNAGKQRTRGIEFDFTWATTDRLTLGVNAALMDGVMVDFRGAGCTDAEFAVADTGPCYTAAESQELFNTPDFEGLIDRSGSKAPRTPDWKFVLDVDYWLPVFENYKVTFNSKTTFSDGYVYNVEEFAEDVKYPSRIVANLNLGFGDQADIWKLTLWARNALNQGVKYYPEFDVFPTGIKERDLSVRNWATYGVQFNYNYN